MIYSSISGSRRLSIGTLSDIHRRAASSNADELMIMTLVHDPAARIRSYQLLGEAFDLDSAGVGVPGPESLPRPATG